MENIIKAVKQAINCKNWFAALYISLTLPDICGAMENPEKGNGFRYKNWYGKYLSEKCKNLTPEACWQLRNACLHEGSDAEGIRAFKRIHFVEPAGGMIIHGNRLNEVLQLQIDVFCRDFCEAVEEWLRDVRNDQEIIARINKLMKVHPISSLSSFIKFT